MASGALSGSRAASGPPSRPFPASLPASDAFSAAEDASPPDTASGFASASTSAFGSRRAPSSGSRGRNTAVAVSDVAPATRSRTRARVGIRTPASRPYRRPRPRFRLVRGLAGSRKTAKRGSRSSAAVPDDDFRCSVLSGDSPATDASSCAAGPPPRCPNHLPVSLCEPLAQLLDENDIPTGSHT
ncbi:hypothetical protein SCALM49S_06712 [Streptomyces californicus]